MQLAWFKKQNWLEIRNLSSDLPVFFEHSNQNHPILINRPRYRLYEIQDSIRIVRIVQREYHLDESLLVVPIRGVVFPPPEGCIRIRVYCERLQRWWLVVCPIGHGSVVLSDFQQEYGWCYVQIQWWIDNRIGPISVVWIPPQKKTTVEITTDIQFGKPTIHFRHEERGYFAFRWIRQPLLIEFQSEERTTWVDELGGTIDVSKGMVGDRYIFWSPIGWSILHEGREVSHLILERLPNHFHTSWVRTSKPYRTIDFEEYNSCLLDGLDRLVEHSPFFSSWLARERRSSLCSQLKLKDGGNLSGELLWGMNHA